MQWELVLENVDGQNKWLLRPAESDQDSDSSASGRFSIDGLKTLPNIISLNGFSEVDHIMGISGAKTPPNTEVVGGLESRDSVSVSGANGVGHSAMHFNTDSSIIFTDYINNSTDLTISFWVYPTSVSGNNRFLFGSKIQGGNDCWSILRDAGNWKVIWDQNNTQSVSMGSVDLDQWQHIAVSWHLDGSDSGFVKFYKNGVLEGERDGVSDGPAGEWTIGGRSNDGSEIYQERFECYMSSISFHQTVLTPAEILELAKADHDQDLSSNFGDYASSGDLSLAILGGTGNYSAREDYPDTYTDADSLDVQSTLNYSLEVTTNTTGGTPSVESGVISYINKFPTPVP